MFCSAFDMLEWDESLVLVCTDRRWTNGNVLTGPAISGLLFILGDGDTVGDGI